MEKNDSLVVTCGALGTQGEGIARADGVTLFVPRFLPGERARVKVLKVKGSVGYAKIEELLTPAEERVRPKCAVFGKCGGCQLQHIKYRAQLKFKTQLVRDTLRKIAGIDADVAACERSEKEYGYRNKLQLPVGCKDGQTVVGFFAERTHRIVPTDACPLHPDWAGKLIDALKNFMEKCGLDGYDEEAGEGQIRHIVVRELRGKFLVTLVVTVPELKGIDYFLYRLDQIFHEYSFYLNFNDKKTNVIFGDEFKLLKGKGVYDCTDAGIVYEAGPRTFVQVNENVRTKLYERALSHVDEDAVVADCYAGGGLLTAKFAKKCKKAYGIEIVPEASACADDLRVRNGLEDKMVNLCGKVEELLAGVLDREPSATVVLDPPRAGCAREVLRLLLERKVPKIIMISCDPATLARDVGLLTGSLTEQDGALVKSDPAHGVYKLRSVEPFDMFPQTKHVETLVLLSKNSDSHINVTVEFGEGEGQISLKEVEKRAEARKPKEKVTYKMIQQYIEENYGFKVHTAYIAEVKRSLGLPMYDAPNAVEELKRPRAHPTEQMVVAIKETLAHFDFI